MLSRHAEHLYWIGRHIERAEDTARMLDVTFHTLLESPVGEADTAWKELLEVLALAPAFGDRPLTPSRVGHFLVLDRENPGSVLSSVSQARENARSVRDRISTELWEAINQFHLELAARDVEGELMAQPYEVLRWIRDRGQLVAGVASETMPRDDGYRFIRLGTLLERAEMACRLLAVRYARLITSGRGMAFHAWVSVLKSVSAFEAYLKEYRAALDPTKVLEFLLLSPVFPRSVLFCLREAEKLLADLTSDDHMRPGVVMMIGRVRAKAEFCDIEQILGTGLDSFLESLQSEIYAVADLADTHFFRSGTELDLHTYESI